MKLKKTKYKSFEVITANQSKKNETEKLKRE